MEKEEDNVNDKEQKTNTGTDDEYRKTVNSAAGRTGKARSRNFRDGIEVYQQLQLK